MKRLTGRNITGGITSYNSKTDYTAGDKEIRKRLAEYENSLEPKPIVEWHEDDGDCLWWFFPIVEPPYCGSPLDADFPDCVTHFTRLIMPIGID